MRGSYYYLIFARISQKQIINSAHFNPIIFLISFSLFNASMGVRLLISTRLISSRICFNTGLVTDEKNHEPLAGVTVQIKGFIF